MPMLDVIDETYVVAPPAEIAAALGSPELWARLFPGLRLRVYEDRGAEGLRFTVSGRLTGSSEFWVEPWGDGAIVHYYLRADFAARVPANPRRLFRRVVRERTAHCVRLKRGLNEVKDRLEGGRAPGTPRVPA